MSDTPERAVAATRAREAIEAGHRFPFAGPLSGSRMATFPDAEPTREIRMLGPAGALGADRASVVPFVLVEGAGAGRGAAFQNTRDAS